MKATSLFAILLAVVFAGLWIQSERRAGHVVSEQAGTFATPLRNESTNEAGNMPSSSPGRAASVLKPDRAKLDQKLVQNEQELSAAQERLQRVQDELQTSGLDQQIQREQQNVIDLQAQAKTMGGQSSNQLQNQAILAEQDNQLLQQQAAGLQQQMQAQQGISDGIELQIRHTTAPNDSDLMVGLNQELQESEQKKQKIRDEYNAVLQQQQQLAMNRYSSQAQSQQQQQAGSMSTDVALDQAKIRLDGLNRQKQQLASEADQSQKQVEQLRAERSSLLEQAQ